MHDENFEMSFLGVTNIGRINSPQSQVKITFKVFLTQPFGYFHSVRFSCKRNSIRIPDKIYSCGTVCISSYTHNPKTIAFLQVKLCKVVGLSGGQPEKDCLA